jgi:hypothetical protein
MSPSVRKLMFVAMFALPALCYFIGMGTVLNMAVSSAVDDQKALAQLEKTCKQAAGENQALAARLGEERDRVGKLRLQVGDEARRRVAISKRLGEQIVAGNRRLRQQHAEAQGIVASLNDARSLAVSLDVLRQKLREADAEVSRLSAERDATAQDKKKKERTPRVILDGSGGQSSRRKPVYLVCSAQNAILEPEGRQLGSDPSPFDQQAFLAAVRATGYVVFLIRPDGVPCFMIYRRFVTSDNAISGQPIQFGFEPVNADWDCSNPG